MILSQIAHTSGVIKMSNMAYLHKIGVPSSLLGVGLTELKPFVEQFGRFQKSYKDYQVFVVLGSPTPYKDAFIVLMLKWFIHNNPDLNASYGFTNMPVSLLVLPSIETTFNKDFNNQVAVLAQTFYEKKIIICDIPTLEQFKILVGAELFKYLSYSMGVINLELKEQTKIKEI